MALANADKNVGRQYPLVAFQEFDFADLTAGAATPIVKLPAGARVIGGELVISTIFNSGTSDKLDVGDGGSATRYIAGGADNASTAQRIAIVPTGYKYTAGDTVDVTWTAAGAAATAGDGYLMVQYIIDGRANEVVPDYS